MYSRPNPDNVVVFGVEIDGVMRFLDANLKSKMLFELGENGILRGDKIVIFDNAWYVGGMHLGLRADVNPGNLRAVVKLVFYRHDVVFALFSERVTHLGPSPPFVHSRLPTVLFQVRHIASDVVRAPEPGSWYSISAPLIWKVKSFVGDRTPINNQ